ncbi:MAG: dipeptidase PepE [Bacteroidales bacterium]|nr:dipeptidase PepE [Bacteroidales bacterium]
MQLLLLSNSTHAGQAYLSFASQPIKNFLGDKPLNICFIPYAAVTFSYEDYEKMLSDALQPHNYDIKSIHRFDNKTDAVNNADVIMTGGGNTFHLVKTLQENRLMEPIRNKVLNGTPYIGWSAGSNICCPTICTTNDMPIVQPESFNALNLVPFQINPHYNNQLPPGHAGETRDMRISEYITANPNSYVAGLPEGCYFFINNNSIEFKGSELCRIFKHNTDITDLKETDSFQFLLDKN